MTPAPHPDPTEAIARAAALLRRARRIVALTGAGVSAESGVPTFRGADGLWKSFRPEQLATPEAFARDPRLVWEWYGWRLERVRACTPNAAHHALARLALTHEDAHVVTQNVDGLHGQAAVAAAHARGADAGRALPLELHGSIRRARCTRCGAREPLERVDATDRSTLPSCARCGALLRPDIVWFGESLDPEVLERASVLASAADLCLVIGTSGVVYPAAGLAGLTHRGGGAVVEINPEATPLSGDADIVVRLPAAEAVPAILGPG